MSGPPPAAAAAPSGAAALRAPLEVPALRPLQAGGRTGEGARELLGALSGAGGLEAGGCGGGAAGLQALEESGDTLQEAFLDDSQEAPPPGSPGSPQLLDVLLRELHGAAADAAPGPARSPAADAAREPPPRLPPRPPPRPPQPLAPPARSDCAGPSACGREGGQHAAHVGCPEEASSLCLSHDALTPIDEAGSSPRGSIDCGTSQAESCDGSAVLPLLEPSRGREATLQEPPGDRCAAHCAERPGAAKRLLAALAAGGPCGSTGSSEAGPAEPLSPCAASSGGSPSPIEQCSVLGGAPERPAAPGPLAIPAGSACIAPPPGSSPAPAPPSTALGGRRGGAAPALGPAGRAGDAERHAPACEVEARLLTLERALEEQRSALAAELSSRPAAACEARLLTLERALEEQRSALAAELSSRPAAACEARLLTLERALEDRLAAELSSLRSELGGRLAAAAEAGARREREAQSASAALEARVEALAAAVEPGLAAASAEAPPPGEALAPRLRWLEGALDRLASEVASSKKGGRALEELSARLGGLERSVEASGSRSERALEELSGRLGGLDQAATARGLAADEARAQLLERVRALERSAEASRRVADDAAKHDELAARVGGMQQSLEALQDGWQGALDAAGAAVARAEAAEASCAEASRVARAALSEEAGKLRATVASLRKRLDRHGGDELRAEVASQLGQLRGQLASQAAAAARQGAEQDGRLAELEAAQGRCTEDLQAVRQLPERHDSQTERLEYVEEFLGYTTGKHAEQLAVHRARLAEVQERVCALEAGQLAPTEVLEGASRRSTARTASPGGGPVEDAELRRRVSRIESRVGDLAARRDLLPSRWSPERKDSPPPRPELPQRLAAQRARYRYFEGLLSPQRRAGLLQPAGLAGGVASGALQRAGGPFGRHHPGVPRRWSSSALGCSPGLPV